MVEAINPLKCDWGVMEDLITCLLPKRTSPDPPSPETFRHIKIMLFLGFHAPSPAMKCYFLFVFESGFSNNAEVSLIFFFICFVNISSNLVITIPVTEY